MTAIKLNMPGDLIGKTERGMLVEAGTTMGRFRFDDGAEDFTHSNYFERLRA